jgi:tetratricopeptide (TPR) repeat protein
LDTDSDLYIRRYLNYFQGRHYIKEAYQKLAWHAWVIEGDSVEYRRNMTFCLLKGEDLIDEDKQALNLACQRLLPNRTLLKVRLLSDGAYLNEALAELEQLDSSDLKLNHAIEYAYRKARILQNLGRLQEAIDSYQHCLSFSYTEDLYYQIASHFYLGQVYELQQDYKSANFHYNQCLKSKSSQYQRSLHQKAKVGLLRLKSK